MMKAILWSGKLTLLSLTFFLYSCGENSALKEETIYFQAENMGWLTDDVRGDNFLMIDNNGISSSFTMDRDSYYWDKSWSSILGINTLMTHKEYHYQKYRSNYGAEFSLSLNAGYPPLGDVITIHLDEIGFMYDIKFELIKRVDTDYDAKSLSITEGGYEEDGESIRSTVEILPQFSTGQHDYDTVLFFRLRDFGESWNDFTPVELYVAKNIGLVSYELNNGITYVRD